MHKIKKLMVLLISAIFVGSVYAESYLGKDNCTYLDKSQVRRISSGELVIVVDQSEELSISHKKQVSDLVSELLADDSVTPVGTRISIFTFGKNDFKANGSGQNIESILSLCKPQKSANPLFQNVRKVNHLFESRYLKPIQSAIDGAISGSLGERSPIMEMVQYVSTHTALNRDYKSGPKRLILISDLLQHSEGYSSYNNKRLQVPERLHSSLKGWDVIVLAPKRYGSDQTLQVGGNLKIWNTYFKTAEVSTINIKFLP